MLRVLLPSWRFFDDVVGSPTLMIRCSAASGELGPWRAVQLAARRGVTSWFVNARGNLALAHHSLLEHLLSDVADLDASAAADAVEQLVSYRLVTRLAEAQLGAQGSRARTSAAASGDPPRFQFKLTVLPDIDDGGRGAEDLLISKLHDA